MLMKFVNDCIRWFFSLFGLGWMQEQPFDERRGSPRFTRNYEIAFIYFRTAQTTVLKVYIRDASLTGVSFTTCDSRDLDQYTEATLYVPLHPGNNDIMAKARIRILSVKQVASDNEQQPRYFIRCKIIQQNNLWPKFIHYLAAHDIV